MSPFRAMEEIPDVPDEQRTSDELIKRARKLRWMGFKDEAHETQRTRHTVTPTGSALTAPRETDQPDVRPSRLLIEALKSAGCDKAARVAPSNE